MNQNRNQNRRRGRGNNRGGQGGGNQGNRIDSRARGNAPQMLEKYRKLAHDASLNGDRVQTEYYLQFADHYFRVVADSRQQKDDQQPRREHQRDDREQSSAGYDSDDYQSEDQESGRDSRPPRRDRDDDDRDERAGDRGRSDEGSRAYEGDEADADDNPFTRDARGPKERSGQRGRGRGRAANDADAGHEPNGRVPEPRAERPEAAEEPAGFDAGILPPSIPREEDAAPRPRRARKPRPADDNGDETLEAVS